MDENNRDNFEPNTGEQGQNRNRYQQPQNGYNPQQNQYGQPNQNQNQYQQPQYNNQQYGQQYNGQQYQYNNQQYQQNGCQQPQYPYSYTPAPVVPGKSKATAALILGIISIVICWSGIVSLCIGSIVAIGMGVAAVVLGVTAKKVMPSNQNGVAIGGIICGAIGAGLSLIFTIYSIWLYAVVFSLVGEYGHYYSYWD